MAKVYANDFSFGEASKKMYGRIDLEVYAKSVSVLENFFPMLQGGIKRRPGTVEILNNIDSKTRIIPYVYSVDSAYLILISNLKLKIYKNGTFINETVCEYTESELFEIQYSQSWDSLFLTHRNHSVNVLKHIGIDSFVFGPLQITTDSKNTNLFNGINNYPGCVAFYANRLWLASSISEPYTIWISEPLIVGEKIGFKFFELIEETTKEIKDPPWPEGWEDDNSLVYEEKIITDEVITASNALKLVVGTSSNDRIEWLCSSTFMVVGTASSEWVIPSNINAQQYSISQVSGYGSASIQALMSNNEILYIQSDKKRLRTYSYSSQNGSLSEDLTYSSDHILSSGVVEMCWRRVPEPMAFFVLRNGDMAILSYNRLYKQQAWSLIKINGIIESVCVLDSDDGQDIFILTLRNGIRRIERFEDNTLQDISNTASPVNYLSKVVTNPYESRGSLGEVKRGWKVMLKLFGSGKFKAGFEGSSLEIGKGDELGNYAVNTYNPLNSNLQLKIESINENPLNILAILTDLEV